MFKKPVWDDLSFVTVHYPAGSTSEDGYTVVIKGWTWSATILRKAAAFKQCSIGTKGPKVCQENIPTPLHHHHQSEPLRQGRIDPCFHVLYAKFWHYHLNVAAEIETHQTRQRFSNLLLSNFGEPLQIVACSLLTGAAPSVVFCCCNPSASGFNMLCVQRWYSAYLDYNEWLFESFFSCMLAAYCLFKHGAVSLVWILLQGRRELTAYLRAVTVLLNK